MNEMVLWRVLVIITFMSSFESSGRHVRELTERNLKIVRDKSKSVSDPQGTPLLPRRGWIRVASKI